VTGYTSGYTIMLVRSPGAVFPYKEIYREGPCGPLEDSRPSF
jgi:hypothetical protein